MRSSVKGLVFIIFGIVLAIFTSIFDIIAGKPVNDVTGPKSILGFILSAILVIMGIRKLVKKKI